MTVQSTTNRHDYVATAGQTVFPYAFRIFADTELKVYQAGVLKDLTTHYTVSGVDNAYGGNVTLVTGATAGDAIAILRDVDATQLTDWVEAGPTPADSFEDAVDKLTMLAQEHEEIFGRTFQMPESSIAGSPILPTPEIGKFLRWDGTTPPEIGNADLVALGLLGLPVSQVNGGTGQDTSALSGQPDLRTGTWYFNQNHVNVKTYGALGDGIADDTAAIQLALTAAGTLTTPNTYYTAQGKGGTIVFLPPGNYLTTSTLTIPQGVSLVGAGKTSSIITSTVNGPILRNDLGLLYNWFGSRLSDFGIYGDRTKASQIGLDLLRPLNCTVSNVYVQACGAQGVRVRQGITNYLQQVDVVYCVGRGFDLEGGGVSWADATANTLPSNNNTLDTCHAAYNDGAGLYMGAYVNGNLIHGGAYECNYLAAGDNVGYNIELRTTNSYLANILDHVWVEGPCEAHVYQNNGNSAIANKIVGLNHFGNDPAGNVDRAIINESGTLIVDYPFGHGGTYKTLSGSISPFRVITPNGVIRLSFPHGSTIVDGTWIDDQNGVQSLPWYYANIVDFPGYTPPVVGYLQFASATTVTVTFGIPQPDLSYVPLITPTSSAPVWVSNITVNGFVINTTPASTEWVGWSIAR
jgi:hypothetical protein